MCDAVGIQTLQRGMNFELRPGLSVILMSLRPNAPYADRIEDNGRTLIYEGHDIPKVADGPEPKTVDLVACTVGGRLTQNGLFHQAALAFKKGRRTTALVQVYQKIWSGVWNDNGVFRLVDSWQELSGSRKVYKFKLELTEDEKSSDAEVLVDIEHNRVIPLQVKLEVWKRDKGRCVTCGRTDNLHFDHIIPFSKGGSSLVADNIQILCARHNLQKHDKIQ
jgi:hypothetical protein